MPAQYAGQFGPEDIRQQNASTKNLDMPTSVEIKTINGAVDVTLFTDKTMAANAANPVTIGVTPGTNTVGVDTTGNLLAFAAPGTYQLYANGSYVGPIQFHPDPDDVTSRLAALEAAAFTTLLNS